ncbi:MAG: sigma-70 factor domain-containing protein, partial [Cyanobacteria bacterium J06607_10]
MAKSKAQTVDTAAVRALGADTENTTAKKAAASTPASNRAAAKKKKATGSKAATAKKTAKRKTAKKKASSKRKPLYTTDAVRAYLHEIGRVPLLSHEDEIVLGKQVQKMMAL